MGVFQNNLMGAAAAAASGGGGSDFYEYQIANSIRNSAAQDGTLKITAGTPTSRQKFTFSYWVKRYDDSDSSSDNVIFTTGTGGGAYLFWSFASCDFQMEGTGGGWTGYQKSDAKYRDASAWYHHVITFDSTQSTQADRIKIYVNGERITSWSLTTLIGNIELNNEFAFINQSGVVQAFGGLSGSGHGIEGADLQLADIVFNDGQAYGPDSYGETKNGVWIPKDPSGLTFGNNGYHLNFASSSDLGNDVSGNNNDFTVANIPSHDQMGDSPTFNSDSNGGNFCTYNFLNKGTSNSLSEGNLQTSGSAGGNVSGTMAFLTGKWYWEQKAQTVSAYGPTFGIGQLGSTGSATVAGGEYNIITWQTDAGQIYGGGGYPEGMGTITVTQTGVTALSSGDVMGFWLDLDNNKLWITKNGAFLNSGNPATGSNPQASWASTGTQPMTLTTQNVASGVGVLNAGQNPSFNGALTGGNIGSATDKNGFGLFKYDPSGTDFIAMCSANLPTAEEIDPAETDDNFPQKLFSPIIWTGNGGTSRAITGLGFRPDWLWFKSRSSAFSHRIYDTTRGIASTGGKRIFSNTTGAETNQTSGQDISAVGNDGFTLGASSNLYTNDTNSGGLQVGWMWRANGGTTSTNTSGSINSTVQVDPSGGFSIVKYVGANNNWGNPATIGHGLSSAPNCIILKALGAADQWEVFFSDYGRASIGGSNAASNSFALDTGGALYTNQSYKTWGGVMPTSSVFTVDGNNANGTESEGIIAYCFANTEGYINSGVYRGTGNASGTFLYTGFRPTWLMIKRVSGAESWFAMDDKRNTYNVVEGVLQLNGPNAESTTDYDVGDFLSNGFKFRLSSTGFNGDEDYVYLAFAENPFKYATAG